MDHRRNFVVEIVDYEEIRSFRDFLLVSFVGEITHVPIFPQAN